MVALMGASGSGKTTLVNLLGALDQPTSGRYWLDGEEVSALSDAERAVLRNETIGFVFQNFNLLSRLTALENVMMPLAYAADCSAAARVPSPGPGRCSSASAWATGSTTSRRSSPAASSSGWRSRGPWSTAARF